MQRSRALPYQILQVLSMLLEFGFGLPALGDVQGHLQDHGGAVDVGEREVVGVNHAPIGAFDLPMMGLARLENVVTLAERARLAPSKTVFIAAPPHGLAE